MLGNPETRAIISQGRKVLRDVRTAPPFDMPLCCFKRRGGFGVEPIYRDACRIVERSTYTTYNAGSGFDIWVMPVCRRHAFINQRIVYSQM